MSITMEPKSLPLVRFTDFAEELGKVSQILAVFFAANNPASP